MIAASFIKNRQWTKIQHTSKQLNTHGWKNDKTHTPKCMHICNFSRMMTPFLRVHFHTHTVESEALGCEKSVTWTLLTHNHTKQHTPTLLQLYQHLRLVRLQLVLDEWAHKMPLSHFPCCQISQQSERNEFSLWRDWDEDDSGGGGGGGGGGGRGG